MNRQELLHRFQFQDQAIFHNNVYSISTFQIDRLVRNGKRHLALERNFVTLQFKTEAFLVGRLQESGPQGAMDTNCQADNLVRQGISILRVS